MLAGMGTVTVLAWHSDSRELRSKGGAIIDRVQAGERMTVTRSGRTAAELRPLPRKSPAPEVLFQRWRSLPRVDLNRLRDDIDLIVDPSL